MDGLARYTNNSAESIANIKIKGKTRFLVSVLIAVFVVPISVSGTAVALESIAQNLGGESFGQQWALNGFNVTFAASTLVWGTLSDHIGRWRSFQVGGMIFIFGSAVSSIAPDYLLLDCARLVAGLGAGAIFSVGSALLSVVFTGSERARMFALMGAMAGLSLAFGPTLSGWVAQVLNWRYIFAAQGLLLTLSWLLMFISRNLTRHELCVQGTFDWQAAFLFFGLIASVVSAMVLTSTDDSGALLAIIASGAGAICLIGLIIRERRASFPLLNFRLVSQPRFLGVLLVITVASFTFASFVTYTPRLMQISAHLNPVNSGLFVMFMTIPTLIAPLVAGAFITRGITPRAVLVVSVGLMTFGSIAVSLVAGLSLTLLAPMMVILGTGFGLHAGLVDNEGLAAVPEHDAGMAAGWINTVRIGTEAIAVSLFGATFIPAALTQPDPSPLFRMIGLVNAGVALVIGVGSVFAMYYRSSRKIP